MNTQADQADQPDQADLPDLPEMVSATAARSLPSTRAGGQDYGSLINSLKWYVPKRASHPFTPHFNLEKWPQRKTPNRE